MNPRDLLTRLLDYVGEQAKSIDLGAYNLLSNQEFLKRRTDLAGLPGVELDLKVEGDHVWLRVQRLLPEKPPAVDERFNGLIRASDDPAGPTPGVDEPAIEALVATMAAGKPADEHAELERRARRVIAQALAQYTASWQTWADGEAPRRRTIGLYGELFAIKHRLEAEETASPAELVWGIGVSTWRLIRQEDGASIDFDYPLLTQEMEVGLDEATMALSLRPRATDARYQGDAFAVCQVRGAADVERAAREQLAERPISPFDPSSYADALRLVAGNLDSQGRYLALAASDGTAPPPGEHLVVTDTWALFVRPRTNNVLLEDLGRLKKRLADGCEIPAGPASLVTAPSDVPVAYERVDFRGLSSGGGSATGDGEPRDLYFPLPYNQEQVTIVQQLEQAEGVAVQGPPGTGKTHTIANIVSHYLATGRRVLVTSKGEPALAVLQDKIPEEIRPLTVALLTSDHESLRQFENAINAIQERASQLNPELTQREIDFRRGQIDRAHQLLTEVDRRVDEIAKAQLAEVVVDGKALRAQQLAELVLAGQAEHGWFEDTLPSTQLPPLTDHEVARLRAVRRELGPDIAYVQARAPTAADLPSPADVARLHDVLVRMREIDERVGDGTIGALKAATPDMLDAARRLIGNIDDALELIGELDELGEAWAHQLRSRCRLVSFHVERIALEALFDEIEALTEARNAFMQRPVELPPAALASTKVRRAVERGAATGKPFAPLTFRFGRAKKLLAAIKVAGLPPATADDWRHVKRFVDLHVRVTSFVARWNEFAPALMAPKLEGGVPQLRRIETVAAAARKAHRLATRHDALLQRRAEKVFAQTPSQQLYGGAKELAAIRAQLAAHLTRAELSRAATELAALKAKLAGTSGPISEALAAFIDKDIGKVRRASERVAADYARIVAELSRIEALAPELDLVRDAAARLEAAGAPRLGARVRELAVEAGGDDAALPANWREAWTWARLKSYLSEIEAREELASLASRRREVEQQLARLYREMVALAAWLSTKRNASPRVLQALQGYATAIRRIGQGKGPNATRHRRDARHHMTSAAGAVPCWIMSHFKISESMPADIGTFDLVIVDEASQSDLWALPAILRGKKILVVGDDKQVSPDGSFFAAQRIQELRDRFLDDQPFKEDMTPEKSLYDFAARVFASRQVMLREHFRCVPPIIAYSNRAFYQSAIQPLRIPKASERIDPPLVDVHVRNGRRDSRDRNRAEAELIADEIATLLDDPRFAGRTLGVVSLLGLEQAKLVDELVRTRCNAADLLRRHFECGDARTFQGSERDIMFLSMVVDPHNCRALAGTKFEQRFNVAASRARDRMYLVRSVAVSDLSDRDIRLSLLRHFQRPVVADEAQAETLAERCESPFERELYLALVELGYHALPQVQTGAYRIDIVVEGAGDQRLAVECDGDEFHGPERWPHDMARQRVLERAGWTFWRCFASTWLLHRGEVLEELVERLTAMGIEPLGVAELAPRLVERRVIGAGAERDLGSSEAEVSARAAAT